MYFCWVCGGGVLIYLQRFTIIVIRVNAKPAEGSPLVPTNKALPLWFPTTFLFFDLDIFIIDGVSMDDLNWTLGGLLNPPAFRFFLFSPMNFTRPGEHFLSVFVCLTLWLTPVVLLGFTPGFKHKPLCVQASSSPSFLSLSLSSLVSQSLQRAFRRWSTITRYVLKVRPDYKSQVGLSGGGGYSLLIHC